MSFVAHCKITNNTDYRIDLEMTSESGQVDPQSEYAWSSAGQRNICFFKFVDASGAVYLGGSFSWGSKSGVYVDRGWLEDQTISMTAEARGETWTQTSNGGETLLTPDEFEEGGDIHLTFNPQ